MASLRKRGRVWYFRYSDADGVKHEEKGCTDRRATEELARQAESEAAKIRAGLIDRRDTGYRDHGARPLVEHLHDWRAALLARGRTVEHANLYLTRATKIAELTQARRLSDLQPSRVQSALGALRED